jgi:hypothetical protein
VRGLLLIACCSGALLFFASPAAADDWYPHPADALWTWQWTDSVYSTTPTNEKVTVKEAKGSTFTLAWTTADQGNAEDAVESAGTVTLQQTLNGLVTQDWQSTIPPATFPILCARAAQCGNSLASSLYNLIWGSRAPLLAEPLMKGSAWSATGGAANDVAATSTYVGTERVTVPGAAPPVVGLQRAPGGQGRAREARAQGEAQDRRGGDLAPAGRPLRRPPVGVVQRCSTCRLKMGRSAHAQSARGAETACTAIANLGGPDGICGKGTAQRGRSGRGTAVAEGRAPPGGLRGARRADTRSRDGGRPPPRYQAARSRVSGARCASDPAVAAAREGARAARAPSQWIA